MLIFAWGLQDPTTFGLTDDISYHGSNRGQIVVPLQSYSQPPSEDKFEGLDTVNFLVDNVSYLII